MAEAGHRGDWPVRQLARRERAPCLVFQRRLHTREQPIGVVRRVVDRGRADPPVLGQRGELRRLGISKRGNGYLRRLLVHAARAVKRRAKTRDDGRGAWLRGLEARAHSNVATVALAAKLARWSWAVLAKNQAFRPAGA
jgi:hypothetical protein